MATRIAERCGSITAAQQFNDEETGRFFMRVAFRMKAASTTFVRR